MQAWGTVAQEFADGPFSIDVDRMWKLYFDRRRTENYNGKFCKPVVADPSFFGPDVHNVEVDWDAAAADARGYADTQTATTCYKLSSREISQASALRNLLKNEYAALESARCRFTERIQQNGRANSAALQNNLKWLDRGLTGLRVARDGSATILAMGATVITAGGAAGAGLAFTAIGAGLTGTAKAQDSERHLTTQQAIGVAVVSGSFSFVTSVLVGGIAKGAALKDAGKAAVGFFVKVPTKTVTSIMLADMTRRKDEPAKSIGVHAWEVAKDEFLDAAGGLAAGKLLDIPSVNAVVRKMAVVAASVVKTGATDLKGALASKAVRKTAQDKVSSSLQWTIEQVVSKGAPKGKLPEAASRQPVHGGAGLEYHVLLAIISPLSS
jgi:hypothetical protein